MLDKLSKQLAAAVIGLVLAIPLAEACTGITLRARDGAVVFGRTMEWGTFDLNSRLVVVPRGYEFLSHLESGMTGITWKSRYGLVGLDALGKDYILDGINEKGLAVNLFYHPGYAEYQVAKPNSLAKSLGPLDLPQYLLTMSATVDEVRAALAEVRVVNVVEPAIGMAPPIHLMVTDASGKAIVIEFAKGEVQVFDAPLGVITNAPTYDWHITNLRNYVNLSPVALPSKKIEDMNFAPLGAGSGMIGLPGDFTPPSRFVRAVAFTQTARPTATGPETFYEVFRILDNFNLPLGSGEGAGSEQTTGMRSSTIWTTAYDTKNLVMEYHTMHNRRLRQVDLKKIDFSKPQTLVRMPLDQKKEQDIEIVTPKM